MARASWVCSPCQACRFYPGTPRQQASGIDTSSRCAGHEATPSYDRFARLKSVSMLANGIGIGTVIRYWYLFPTCIHASAITPLKK
ncbi:hypothetical protein BCAR13_580052 [Paraburkholderia caribensis]|nr:hypothetical protein BCAR13_580052 [Paraburkholderia caribensis]